MPFTTTIAKQVPILLRKESEKELKVVERNRVISRGYESTSWYAPVIVTPKVSRKIKICLDLSKLKLSPANYRENVGENMQELYFSRLNINSGLANQTLGKNKISNNVHHTARTLLLQSTSLWNLLRIREVLQI